MITCQTAFAAEQSLKDRLVSIVGRSNVLVDAAAKHFSTGYRFGQGPVIAAVLPRTLVEMWRIAQTCVENGVIIIVQAANTGLTGGSTPNGIYDRGVVIVSTRRLTQIHLLRGGREVVCFAGSSLYDLERVLAQVGREPHSVIGSSCIGASVVGGICNNSGGALVRRGPAYTEYALYAQVDEAGRLQLQNHLGLKLGDAPEEVLRRLEAGEFGDVDIEDSQRSASAASAYEAIVRDVDAPTPARFNADPERLYEASGSAGKVMVFAVRLETFAPAERTSVFYIGSNSTAELTKIRREILANSPCLPISGEYIHREAFDLAARYGKDMVVAIRKLGTQRLPALFRAKTWVDQVAGKIPFLPEGLSDRMMQAAGRLFFDHLPRRMRDYRDRYEHHLILKVADDGIDFARQLLTDMFPSTNGDMFECNNDEAERAMLHRFAVAGAAIRCRTINSRNIEDIVALDIALPRSCDAWFETLPEEIVRKLAGKLYYGHFFCHVFHQDYLVKKGFDPIALEHELLSLMDQRSAEYPAEHNCGHLYEAKSTLVDHYRQLDPTNMWNPGVGKTSRARNWA